jgi:hypothetical protein
MKTIRCPCGAEAHYERASSLLDIARQTGFSSIWDVTNGLSPIWLCPQDARRVKAAWLSIVEVTKTETIMMTGFLANFQERDGEGARDGDRHHEEDPT